MCTWLKTPKRWKWLMNSVNIRIKAFSIVNVWIVYHILSPLECIVEKLTKLIRIVTIIVWMCASHCFSIREKWPMVICSLVHIRKYLIDENYGQNTMVLFIHICIFLDRVQFPSYHVTGCRVRFCFGCLNKRHRWPCTQTRIHNS